MYSIRRMVNSLICITLAIFASSMIYADDKSVWSDPATGLTWMRCAIGQKWTGKTCTADKSKFVKFGEQHIAIDFAVALNRDGGFAGYTDWRVPTVEELLTIVKCSNGWWRREIGYKATVEGKTPIMGDVVTVELNGRPVPSRCANGSREPTLDATIFPNSLGYQYYYWTSTKGNYSSLSVLVNFSNGFVLETSSFQDSYVRLVRSSR
jgi:hypothetical protein